MKIKRFALPQNLIHFLSTELANSPELTHVEFRRVIQIALLPKGKDDGRPTMIPKKIKASLGDEVSSVSLQLSNLEKKGLLKRVEGIKGSYELNLNKENWFPESESAEEKKLRSDLQLLEQMKIDALEKLKAFKSKGKV